MKMFLTRIFAAFICAGVMLSTAISTAAESYTVEPKYPIQGNKCGVVRISHEINRDIIVTITQLKQNSYCVYYNIILPANASGNSYDFVLEGRNDATYNISFRIEKYKNSNKYQSFGYDFSVPDTGNSVTSYVQEFNILLNYELDAPELTSKAEEITDENGIVWNSCTFSFPGSDIILGDIDFNQNFNLYDVIAIARYITDPTSLKGDQITAADFNSDGVVNLYDAVALAKVIIGI